ncbi:MAG TPA: phosphomannomutase/phosphoglucomutase, partial [Actinobacteria bacterium]|nr:phosphomannomutase/phosphoglucomutase [Actinomycetota bacterium]
LHVLAELAEAAEPLSTLMAQYERYSASGEINSVVADVPAVLDRVAETFASEGASIDRLDGLTVQGPQWWFNLRPSNTEPLLRLNAEGADPDMMGALRDRVLGLVEEASR